MKQFEEGNYNFAYIRIQNNLTDVSHHRNLPNYDGFNLAISELLCAKIKLPIAVNYGYKPIYDYIDIHYDSHGQMYFHPELQTSNWKRDPIIGSIVILESPPLSDVMEWLNQGTCFKHASQTFESSRTLSYFVWENDCSDVATICFEGLPKIEYSLFPDPIIIYPGRPYAEFNLIMY